MKVVCINDKDLPLGANIVKDKEYTVVKSFINFADQQTFILKEAVNEGRTKFGMPWIGYRADRFNILDTNDIEFIEKVENFVLN